MGFAKSVCDQVVFMEAGQIIETGDPKAFFSEPQTDRAKAFLNKVFHH